MYVLVCVHVCVCFVNPNLPHLGSTPPVCQCVKWPMGVLTIPAQHVFPGFRLCLQKHTCTHILHLIGVTNVLILISLNMNDLTHKHTIDMS